LALIPKRSRIFKGVYIYIKERNFIIGREIFTKRRERITKKELEN